ncbi:leucine-rich repeat-containing protein 27 isoform X3 [Echinops telfairi]|uniref:Leucine-rich repeat-containing protein 27 isoform X3 n=1 Tax=Echinops telfairi TaxID=9371 RepID=A0AC55D767_ECHTE|nr:leucine-rich repeat-containing protein 27 isoform X3 [Echinops telfairi]
MEGSCTHRVPTAADAATPTEEEDDDGPSEGRARPAPAAEEPPMAANEGLGDVSRLPVLDLSQTGFHRFREVFQMPQLKQLYLQKNSLCTIPKDFFQLLPELTWLDLRFNRIQVLPAGIGSHKHLKTLLLERNPIKMLPVELGTVCTLKALNLRHCPLEFPPQRIVQRGLAAILTFLRVCAAETREATSREKATGTCKPPCLAPDPEELPLRAKAEPFPPTEKLRRTGPPKAGASLEEWPSKAEIRRFWKLRQEIVENERAETLGHQLLSVQLPPSLRAVLRTRRKEQPGARLALRRWTFPFKSTLPELSSSGTALPAKRVEEGRVAALRELREKQMLMEQRKRERQILREWREQTWRLKKNKQGLSRLLPLPPPPRNLVASRAPLATELMGSEKPPTNPTRKAKSNQEKPPPASRAPRAPWEEHLEQEVRQHIRQIQERRKHCGGAASQDLEVVWPLGPAPASSAAQGSGTTGQRLPCLGP